MASRADALERELGEMADELLERYEELALVTGLGQALSGVFDPAEACAIAVDRLLRAVRAERAFVGLLEDGALRVVAAHDRADPLLGRMLAPDRGITWTAAETADAVLLHGGERWTAAARKPDEAVRPVLSVPLSVPGEAGAPPEVLGAMTLVGEADRRFSAGDAKLATAVAGQVAVAIRSGRLVASLRETERLKHDLELASRIQRSLLPAQPPAHPGFSIAARCVPADNVGGDYFDHVVDHRGRLSLVVADVAGHSVGSALLMAMARSVLRRELGTGASPGELLTALNATLAEDLERASLFITMGCVRFDPSTGVLEHARAGHNLPIVVPADGGPLVEYETEGLPLGLLADETYPEERTRLEPGDLLVLYTDGVTEAHDPADEMFGLPRLHELLRGLGPSTPPAAVVGAVFDAVRRFAGDRPTEDDVTVVALRAREAA